MTGKRADQDKFDMNVIMVYHGLKSLRSLGCEFSPELLVSLKKLQTVVLKISKDPYVIAEALSFGKMHGYELDSQLYINALKRLNA